MEERNLKQIFVGPKYDKFEKKVFSIPAFFFGEIYFAYRKMLVHSIIVMFILEIINAAAMQIQNFGLAILAILCIRTAIGLFFPLWYRRFYNNKINNILSNNIDKSEQEKINLAQKSGGTSIKYLILFLIISSVFSSWINGIDMFGSQKNVNNNVNMSVFDNNSNQESKTGALNNDGNAKKIENAKITGYVNFGNTTTLYIGDNNEQYDSIVGNSQLLSHIENYDEVSVTIYYTEQNNKKTVVKYELYDTETNEKIENVENEDDLRERLGYYIQGSHEEILTFVEKDGIPGFGSDGEKSYTYHDYKFENENGKELEFRYKIYDNTEDKSDVLEQNKKYKIKFDVEKGTFGDYENVITDIEEV